MSNTDKLKTVTRAKLHSSCTNCKWLNEEEACTNVKSPIYPDYPYVLMMCSEYEKKDNIDD